MKKEIMHIYELLINHFGHRNWWPAETKFEVIVGAVLTQAVSWTNVEKAIKNLKDANLLSFEAIHNASTEEIANHIIPTLYYQEKAKKLKNLIEYIYINYEGNLNKMFQEPLSDLRNGLLSVWGIGEETADSILLYAGDYQVFVVDAYTRRIFSRLGLVNEDVNYTNMQSFMEKNIDADIGLYKDYHAQIVALGAMYCNKNKAKCFECPLINICKYFESLQEK